MADRVGVHPSGRRRIGADEARARRVPPISAAPCRPVLPDPKVFIAGASSGIGAALAAHYAGQGAVLGLCARRLAPTQALFSSLLCKGACYQVDVTDATSLQAAAADFTERFGMPDIVIANAGISVGTSTENAEDLAAFRKIMETNVFGMAVTVQPF